MSSTRAHEASTHDSSPTGSSITRAWVSVVLIPVFLVASVLVTVLLYGLFGYKPENADAPLWVDVVIGAAALVVFLGPCVAAVLYGMRASRRGDRRGLIPLVLGALAGLGLTALTVASTFGPF